MQGLKGQGVIKVFKRLGFVLILQIFTGCVDFLCIFKGAKYHLGKVKPRYNAGQRSFDPGGLGRPCLFIRGSSQFTDPVACFLSFASVF